MAHVCTCRKEGHVRGHIIHQPKNCKRQPQGRNWYIRNSTHLHVYIYAPSVYSIYVQHTGPGIHEPARTFTSLLYSMHNRMVSTVCLGKILPKLARWMYTRTSVAVHISRRHWVSLSEALASTTNIIHNSCFRATFERPRIFSPLFLFLSASTRFAPSKLTLPSAITQLYPRWTPPTSPLLLRPHFSARPRGWEGTPEIPLPT